MKTFIVPFHPEKPFTTFHARLYLCVKGGVENQNNEVFCVYASGNRLIPLQSAGRGRTESRRRGKEEKMVGKEAKRMRVPRIASCENFPKQ